MRARWFEVTACALLVCVALHGLTGGDAEGANRVALIALVFAVLSVAAQVERLRKESP